MTFSIVGMCQHTGMFGAAVTTSSIGVGSRCPFARAGVGAVLTQHRTDPRLGPRGWSGSGRRVQTSTVGRPPSGARATLPPGGFACRARPVGLSIIAGNGPLLHHPAGGDFRPRLPQSLLPPQQVGEHHVALHAARLQETTVL